jgi:GT2 family glycosyltransferase
VSSSVNRHNASPRTEPLHIEELLELQGRDFVSALYRTLLGRKPDPDGLANYLGLLEQGTARSEVLAQICSSAEYRRSGRTLPGLAAHLRRYRLRRWVARRVLGQAGTVPAAPLAAAAPATTAAPPWDEWMARMDMLERLVREFRGDNTAEVLDQAFASFRPDGYLEHNPDVAATGMNPFEHWVLAGHRENRRWGLPPAGPVEAAEPLAAAPALPAPDGHWEWADHDAVAHAISATRSEHLQGFVPRALALLKVEDTETAAAIEALRLPPPPAAPEVSIIIPVFNHLALTLECLQSIAQNTAATVSYEVILADDASSPEVSAALARIRNVRHQRNPENLGFLRNCNAALPLARGRWVLFLNNDVQVPSGWLQALRAVFERSDKVGIVGPAFVYPSGHLQEAGGAFRADGTALMVGINDDPELPAYSFPRRVDYVSGACLMIRHDLLRQLGGFSEEFLPCYCEDSDLCLRAQEAGYEVVVEPRVHVVHHLSRTTGTIEQGFKMRAATRNIARLAARHAERLAAAQPRVLAFYLPQFHPIPENDLWWGEGFTEWSNVSKARPNYPGHYQPRLPADLGYYDLRLNEVLQQQAALARRYGIDGFVFYYYWFNGKRVLETPIERMLQLGKPDFPFCLCWANENWTRRWDGRDRDLLLQQAHSPADDLRVIADMARYLRDPRNIRIGGRPLLLIYRVTLFPDFAATARRWREWCREAGIGEIYLAMVESFELVSAGVQPAKFGCDAAVEFPPQGLADLSDPPQPLLNPEFSGRAADYPQLAVRYAAREWPAYPRFKGVMPGWDNTARRQNDGLAFARATPGAFQAWLTDALDQTVRHHHGDERLVFVNAWNEWAEGAYLEPDRRFGHDFLAAVRNARDAALLRANASPY